jgi:integrase
VERWLRRWKSEKDKKRNRVVLLEQFPETVGRDPIGLLHGAIDQQLHGQEPLELVDALNKWHSYKLGRGEATSAARWYWTIRGFFTANGVRFFKIPRGVDTSKRGGWERFTPKQEQVKSMVRTRKEPQDKAVIAFLAQTGQKIGVLTAMTWEMIKRVDLGARGVVAVPRDLKTRRGESANQSGVEYMFVIGRDTMQLLAKDGEGWVFDVSERQINRIVDEAAKDAGIQDKKETKVKERYLRRVTPNTFRRYWKARMRKGEADLTLIEYMMGYKNERITFDLGSLGEADLLDAYKKAEVELEVL